MARRSSTLGILCCVSLVAGLLTDPLSAADRVPGTGPFQATSRDGVTGSTGRRSGSPRPASSLFAEVSDDLLSDEDLSDGLGNRLIGLEPSALPLPPAPAGEEELDFDPWYGDFQRAAPGDEQPYWIMPDDDEPLGWIGEETQRPMDLSGSDFFPVPDRYRLGFPKWDRYVKGSPFDPYNQNVLKGDYPLNVGGNTFLEVTGVSDSFTQFRRKEINKAGGSKLENDTQRRERLFLTMDLFQDDNTFTPSPWFVRLTQVQEWRFQDDAVGYNEDYAWVEAFLDYRLAFLSEFGDQINLRAGRQAFQSDFRGFLYSDVNNMARLFGTWDENKWQYNFIAMDAVQADKVSQFLRTNTDRSQFMTGGNVFRRDAPWLGFNLMGAGFYVHDDGTGEGVFNKAFNKTAGVAAAKNFGRHTVDAGYLEFAAEGVIGSFGVSGAFIQALGRDQSNPYTTDSLSAGRPVNINAQFAALEITRPTNWFTPRMSILYASGDKNPKDGKGRGFDAIFDNANFAGGNFTYFNREQLQGRNAQLTNFNSFLPNLRNRFFDPMNFVNPGIMVLTAGCDTTVTTKLNAFVNYNYYRYMEPAALEQAIVASGGTPVSIDNDIGQDLTLGLQYRPLIINNITFNVGSTGFIQGKGFRAITGNDDMLFTHFLNAVIVY